MLRRTESVAPKFDTETVAAMRLELERSFGTEGSRSGPTPAFRPRVRSGAGTFRLALVAVALVAGGLAAYLVLSTNNPVAAVAPPVTTQVVAEPRTQILVAKAAIPVGERLSADAVEWADWPEGAIRPEYITIKATPNAVTDMSGDVARYEFFPGEPIRMEKLAAPSQGYMSAILATGMRAVSVSVTPDSASGGFIVPNDHVDVVLTHTTGQGSVAETVLHDVRVLAINANIGDSGGDAKSDTGGAEVFSDAAIATLELDQAQAEVIINSVSVGKLTLVLRSVADSAKTAPAEHRSANEAIRMSSPFWTH